tara:strand:+ start:383 stop:496 length:114 start_codon:yes stop_codon:yes gene_type:complete
MNMEKPTKKKTALQRKDLEDRPAVVLLESHIGECRRK